MAGAGDGVAVGGGCGSVAAARAAVGAAIRFVAVVTARRVPARLGRAARVLVVLGDAASVRGDSPRVKVAGAVDAGQNGGGAGVGVLRDFGLKKG